MFPSLQKCQPLAVRIVLLALSLLFFANTVYAIECFEERNAASWLYSQGVKDTIDNINSKSPKGAMLRSLAIPGWGQWYNEQKFKALLVFATEAGITVNSILQNQYVQQSKSDLERDYYINNRNLSNLVLIVSVLVSMLDAYVDAHLYKFDESPDISFFENSYINQTMWIASFDFSF